VAALADLPAVAVRVSQRLTAAAIPHAISGSIAAMLHGYVRATLDVDLLVVTPRVRLPAVFDAVRAEGFDGADRAMLDEIARRYCAALSRGPLRFEVFVPVFPWHATLVQRAVLREIDGTQVPVVTVEDLVVLKMLWYRDKDAVDVPRLLEANRGKSDISYMRTTMAALLPADDARLAMFERLLADHA
jgi:predicted nucleotidyltransferase